MHAILTFSQAMLNYQMGKKAWPYGYNNKQAAVFPQQEGGWTDAQDDLVILEVDEGIYKVLRHVEFSSRPRKEGREQERRWRGK